jgi:glucosamine--fructose-6-phosphate aminotransferase (isomerizing)
MCGIIGYVGQRECADLIVDGLRRLEYRGYDSAGIAVLNENGFDVRRAAGKLDRLAEALKVEPLQGFVGIGHTRWATHGAPTEANAHPHRAGTIAVVHNGIIENHRALRAELEADGSVFTSQTDTEIVAHLVVRERNRGLALPDAVRQALIHVHGAYAIAVLDQTNPAMIIAAKNASPLVVGFGEGENFLASDIPAILGHTRRVAFLDEGQMAILTQDGVVVQQVADGTPVELKIETITWTPAMAEKDGYKHYMLKEIHEQPRAVVDTLRGRVRMDESLVDLPEMNLTDEELAQFNRIIILACGTSYHAGMVGEYLIERFARVPVEMELASEFRYRGPIVDDKCLVIAISQSGETADTIAAIKETQRLGGCVVGICNVVGSTITRLARGAIMTHAGPEVSVASTKAFTTQISVLYLLALKLAEVRNTLSPEETNQFIQDLVEAPAQMEAVLKQPRSPYLKVARRWNQTRSVLYLGRGMAYPLALEGALKLKEISYLHAEGYAAGEMKHGPIALIDEELPCVVICPDGPNFGKTLANVSEIKARGGPVVVVTSEGEAAQELVGNVDTVLTIPDVPEHIQPLVASVPLQLLAYHVADFKGTDVDQPRNLAKSVTVE